MRNQDMVVVWERKNTDRIDSFFSPVLRNGGAYIRDLAHKII